MTNDEIPNDEGNDEALMTNGDVQRLGDLRAAAIRVGHGIHRFVIRISGFLRHWVFRHSSLRWVLP